MKNLIFLFIGVIGFHILVGQSSFCGTSGNFSNVLASTPSQFMNNQGPYLIRVFIHAVRNSAGTNGVTNGQILDALNILQTDFNPHNICFSLVGIGSINNDDFMTWNDNCPGGTSQGTNDDDDFDQLINTNVSANAIDIYILPDNIYHQGQASGTPGRAFVIGGSLSFNGVNSILRASKVISHEMGHCLGLFHTFHGTCVCEQNGATSCSGSIINACPELVNGTNGNTCGDFVQDTPADPIRLFNQPLGTGCTWNNTNMRDANNQLYDPDERIIMSYTFPQCMQLFTQGQGQRMRNVIANSTILQTRTVPNDVFVQNRQFTSGNILFAGLSTITAGSMVTEGAQGNVSISSTAICEFRSRNSISLMPGFSAAPTSSGMFFTTLLPTLCGVADKNNSARLIAELSEYQPLIERHKRWLITVYGFEGNISSEFTIGNDTLINGLTYTTVKEKYVSNVSGLNNDPSVTGGFGPSLYLREDINTKQVFRLVDNMKEEILYDFELKVGDAHPIYSDFFLTTVDSIVLEDENRQRFIFDNGLFKIVWIVGIGNLGHPFLAHANTTAQMRLLCVSTSGKYIYQTNEITGFDCENVISATDNVEASLGIKIYPNPSSGKIIIEGDVLDLNSNGESLQINIFDLTGARVISIKEDLFSGVFSKSIELGENLKNSIYVVQVIQQGKVFSQRIVLTR
jgi:hypothetical protein